MDAKSSLAWDLWLPHLTYAARAIAVEQVDLCLGYCSFLRGNGWNFQKRRRGCFGAWIAFERETERFYGETAFPQIWNADPLVEHVSNGRNVVRERFYPPHLEVPPREAVIEKGTPKNASSCVIGQLGEAKV